VSRHVCERYGWTYASLATYRTRKRFDLVICDDVLQYLTDAEAARAIANLGRLCRGALFLQAPTREDWQRNADRSCSDEDIHLRSTSWYRTRLMRRFRHAGFGLYVRRTLPLLQWELSRAGY
jgi:chemotaxis methyl-accepting protein methylase